MIDDELTDGQIRYLRHRTLITPLPFLLSIPIAFVSTGAAEAMWALVVVIYVTLRRIHPETV